MNKKLWPTNQFSNKTRERIANKVKYSFHNLWHSLLKLNLIERWMSSTAASIRSLSNLRPSLIRHQHMLREKNPQRKTTSLLSSAYSIFSAITILFQMLMMPSKTISNSLEVIVSLAAAWVYLVVQMLVNSMVVVIVNHPPLCLVDSIQVKNKHILRTCILLRWANNHSILALNKLSLPSISTRVALCKARWSSLIAWKLLEWIAVHCSRFKAKSFSNAPVSLLLNPKRCNSLRQISNQTVSSRSTFSGRSWSPTTQAD